ncbi:MAG: DNA polymerase/3'-5' exonuclease PolX [Anaerolineales bacterium]|nr:DNA polymerase/3'-5' exonuclease PolX [Anaerolineales bacterium]
MENSEIADVFERIANLLEIKGEAVYRVRAYRRASESIRAQPQSMSSISDSGDLSEIPGVGKAIAEKIGELLEKGNLEFYERLTADVPETLLDVLDVQDIGPKKAALFWKELQIETVSDLEEAAKAGRLKELPGIGEKSEKRIIANIEAQKQRLSDRFQIGEALPIAESLLQRIYELPGVEEAQLAGSLRRWRETIGDLDIVVGTNEASGVLETFSELPEVERVLGLGDVKASVELKGGLRAQLWVHPPDKFGSALQYATGSQDHNVHLREIASSNGLSLSEHGFKRDDGSEFLCADEVSLYQTLGMEWVPPELREDQGEIQAALERRLPELVNEEALTGELHSHSDWSDGHVTIEEMASASLDMGLNYLVISDHSRSLGIANGLSIDRLNEQRKEINRVQRKLGDSIRLLHGSEVEILADGRLDYPDSVLAELDIVIASVHSSLRQPREQITQRFLNAIQNPHVDLIAHPSGRLIGRRDPADIDIEQILAAAAENGVILEINSHPDRLDLNDLHSKRALELGCKLAITTDAHRPEHLQLRRYGIGVARRAWASSESIVNSWPKEHIIDWLNSRG